MTKQPKVLITLEELREAGAYWQKRLRLEAWDINWMLVTSRQINGDKGQNDFRVERLDSLIYIALDNQDDEIDLLDTIIHELLHLSFWFVSPGDHDTDSKLLEVAFKTTVRAMASDHWEIHEWYCPRAKSKKKRSKQ